MDTIISNGSQLKQRQLIVALLTAATCGAGVYLFHTPFHYWLHAAGMPDRISDTVGSITIVLLSVIINNLISLAIFKEVSLGIRAIRQKQGNKVSGFSSAPNLKVLR